MFIILHELFNLFVNFTAFYKASKLITWKEALISWLIFKSIKALHYCVKSIWGFLYDSLNKSEYHSDWICREVFDLYNWFIKQMWVTNLLSSPWGILIRRYRQTLAFWCLERLPDNQTKIYALRKFRLCDLFLHKNSHLFGITLQTAMQHMSKSVLKSPSNY